MTRIVGSGSPDQVPFTPPAKQVFKLALGEAHTLGHDYIGTEHLLLGLVEEKGCRAVRILRDFGADPDRAREEVMRLLSSPGAPLARDDRA